MINLVMTTANQKNHSSRRFLSPTLTLSATALSATAAHGAEVVTDFADLTAIERVSVYVSFDPTTGSATASTTQPGIPNWAFNASRYYDEEGKSGWTRGEAYATWQPATILSASPLLPGGTMDNTTALSQYIRPLPGNLTDAYFGVRLQADINSSNGQYGWIKITTGPDLGGNGATSITVLAAGLETTPNAGITIPSAVPEPSSALLLGLAAGAGAFRRRRSQAA